MILEWFIPIQNESSNISDIFSIVFGVSSGILTLVGLIAVFTSLISQQIVEKLRAEWWNLHEVSDEAQSLLSDIEQGHFDKSHLKDLSVKLNRALWKYKRVYSDKSLFMNLVVILGIISLFFCWKFMDLYLFLH
ncbi:hypothetical protein [Peribacillus frigoritolerans]|uniref:hypothetical protein n=1 Tax=Peribacillus frigoritolerans TaxID=450367 RepID=UPI0024C1F920|nr:hypothetical protein [Peribacillus frigoritolerans]WHX59888.1 hypothetical protein QNH33_14640 [Peribacillus frigoritolerans]